ncbi:hypothetical protein [Chitinilyticum litopenaei]|uniref:hypothetical protein n=1 Tax=Chitinilyticum litopenaei TaxID=1121276 RepID=UPI00042A1E4C|nr:hypothetical protein [Chitinilyticum litopenaei]
MSHFLFFQPFLQGRPATYSRAELLALLGPHGEADLDENDGDPSFRFHDLEIAASAYLVADAQGETRCLTLTRPGCTEKLRQLAFAVLDRLGGFVFDGELACIYHVHGSAADLPASMREGCSGMLCRVVAPQQLWPEMHVPDSASQWPVLHHGDQDGARFFVIDRQDGKTLQLDLPLSAAACNPATLRGIYNHLLRLRSALNRNPGYALRLCFTSNEASLQLLESQNMPQGLSGTIVNSGEQLFGAGESRPRFVADHALYRQRAIKTQAFLAEARQRFGAAPALNAGGAARFDAILEQIHQLYLREQQGKPQKTYSKAAANWAELTGFALGEAMRLENGGQWGLVERGCGLRWPAVQFGDGTLCFPLNHSLNRIIGGSEYAIPAWFAAHAAHKHHGDDVAGGMLMYVDVLLGGTVLEGKPLPLADRVPRDRLDFSLASLKALDDYAASAGAAYQGMPNEDVATLVLALGGYLGEVIRRNASQHWQWRNYADYFAGRQPTFAQTAFSSVLLESDDRGVQVLQAVKFALAGTDTLYRCALEFAPELAGEEADAATQDTQSAAGQPDSRAASFMQAAPVLVYAFVLGGEQS